MIAQMRRIDNFFLWLCVGILIVFIDFTIYIALGVAMMGYDDFYDPSKGEYGSWESMNAFDKKVYVLLIVWNFLNLVGIIFLGYKLFRFIKNWKNPVKIIG